MPVIFRPSFASSTGWTEINIGAVGTIAWGVAWDSQVAVEITRAAVNGWNDLGIERAWPSTGIGYVCYFDWFFPGSGTDMEYCLNDSAGLAINSSVGIYSNGSGNVYNIYNGSTAGPVNPPGSGRFNGRLTIAAAGEVDLDWKAPGAMSWTNVGITSGIDYSTGTIRQQINLFTDTKTGRMANLFLTDDGTFTPPAPASLLAGTPTTTTIPLTWSDGSITTTNADGIDIFADDGGGDALVGTAAVGAQAGTATGLTEDTSYALMVKAFFTYDGTKYYSAESNTVTISTSAASGGGDGESLLVLGEL